MRAPNATCIFPPSYDKVSRKGSVEWKLAERVKEASSLFTPQPDNKEGYGTYTKEVFEVIWVTNVTN